MLPLVVALIVIVPPTLALAPAFAMPETWMAMAWLPCALPVYLVSFVLTAGLLSRIGKPAIVPGVFPRSPSHPVYKFRRIYGTCWTTLYYAKWLYWVVLTLAPLKRLAFRLYGYQGPVAFTNYPDTWIRDLPLLRLGQGAYLANRATIGTNMCLSDGTILVDKIEIGEAALVGHLALIGPGSTLAARAEVGTRGIVGLKAKIGEGAVVGPDATIGHKATIGKGAKIGHSAYVGSRAVLGEGVEIPPALVVLGESRIETQADADRLRDQQIERLRLRLDELSLSVLQDAG